MALFVTGDTAPFFSEFLDVFVRIRGFSVSLGALIPVIVGSEPVSLCVHGIRVWEWHLALEVGIDL